MNEAAHALPRAYARHRVGTTELVAHDAVLAALAGILARGETLHDWASDLPQPQALRGRAPVYVASLPGTGATVVVRHSWHGGLLAPLSRDLYLPPTRAPLELALSLSLRSRGIPTTELLGYATYAAGPLRRVDVVSRYVPDAHDLGAVAAGLAPGWSFDEAIPAVADTVRRLSEQGFVHPDLNVKNLLLVRDRHVPRALVIDVDVVRRAIDRASTDDAAGARIELATERNVARLVRSLRKWRTQFGAAVSDAQLQALQLACRP